MTHNDILTKYLIEYDKANITSSYPSQTEYEIATILDKAYLALIAQKLTGNNPRQTGFETDTKAIEDIRPLIANTDIIDYAISTTTSNEYIYTIPSDCNYLYYVQSLLEYIKSNTSIDDLNHTFDYVLMVNHGTALKFKSTSTNLPWLQHPMCYLEGDTIKVLIDPYLIKDNKGPLAYHLTYIKKPNKFTKDNDVDFTKDTIFELSDSMAEELINEAILMSTKIIESSRLTPEVQLRSLES